MNEDRIDEITKAMLDVARREDLTARELLREKVSHGMVSESEQAEILERLREESDD